MKRHQALEVSNMANLKLSNIEKLQRRVRKRYPGAYAVNDVGWHIVWNDINLNDIFLLDNSDTEEAAWEQAVTVAKHEQHINRTHPLKKMWSQTAKNQNKERIAKRIHYAR